MIHQCRRRAIDLVLAYADREVCRSRSGTIAVVREDIDGVVATGFLHWDSRAGDPQSHNHFVIANRARSTSDEGSRTLDSRGLFKYVVVLSELHQDVLSDLLTERLGWGRAALPPLRPAPLQGERAFRSVDGRTFPAVGGHRGQKAALHGGRRPAPSR